ncbi:DUF4974 domain-containing protein [Puteibacter caeruleilacunae]|nr:DUF4974 domain-containing protein [Puteibacter caeruleilacunae]
MKKEEKNIESSDIWLSIHNKLDEEGEENLVKWLTKSERHRDYYSNAKEYYESSSDFDKVPVKSQSIYYQVQKRINSKRRLLFVGRVASAITVLISLVYGGYYILDNTRNEEPEILAGSSKATLILENGKKVDLGSTEPLKIKQGRTVVEASQKNISYKKTVKKKSRKERINQLDIPVGGEFFLTLSDGTKVWLNSASKLKYPVNFIKKQRIVELEGEAFFEVAKDSIHPFIVKTRDQEIRVLGTQYNVSAYADDIIVKTTLVEGSVEVRLNNTTENYLLKPSEQLVLNRETKQCETRVVDTDTFISWKNGEYFFVNQPLHEIFKVLSRWYDFQPIFIKEEAKTARFTGSLHRQTKLNTILEIIEKTQNLKIEVHEKNLIIN